MLEMTGPQASLRVRKDDLYETPTVAVRSLLKAEQLPAGAVWEPACGRGAIVKELISAGYRVYATDLVNYGDESQDAHGVDFLMQWQAPDFHIGCILTNPPFKLAEQFVRRALVLAPRVIMLLRLAFMESESRSEILDSGMLARVHVFRKRLPMMHRDGYLGPRTQGGSIAFAWFVWDRNHTGPTTLDRI